MSHPVEKRPQNLALFEEQSPELLRGRTEEAIAQAKTGPELAKHIIQSGWMRMAEDQRVYVIEWGKKGGNPFVLLHGGPGDSVRPSHFDLFNPDTDYVIALDQRQCGESVPNATTLSRQDIERTNTTELLVEDMVTLLDRFGVEKAHIVGGSWGSFLAVYFSAHYPERTASRILWGFYGGQREQVLSVFEDRTHDADFAAEISLEPWNELVRLVPESARRYTKKKGTGTTLHRVVDPLSILEYYASDKGVNNSDLSIAVQFAQAYLIYEYSLCRPDGWDTDPKGTLEKIRKFITEDINTLPAARIEMTYDINGAYVNDQMGKKSVSGHTDEVADYFRKTRDIETILIQGMYDNCTPTRFARPYEKAFGKPFIREVKAGHLRSDRELANGIKEAIRNAKKP